jgi:hypothetical protein
VQFVGIWNLEVRAKPYGSGDSIPPSPFGWVDRAVLLTAGRLGGRQGGSAARGPGVDPPAGPGGPGLNPTRGPWGGRGAARSPRGLARRERQPRGQSPKSRAAVRRWQGRAPPPRRESWRTRPEVGSNSSSKARFHEIGRFLAAKGPGPVFTAFGPALDARGGLPRGSRASAEPPRRCPGRWSRRSSITRHTPARAGRGSTEK